MWPFIAAAAVVVGTGIQAYGQYKSNKAAQGSAKNEQLFYQWQADLAQKKAEREAVLFNRELKNLIADQEGIFAKASIAFSGSAAIKSEETARYGREEEMNIREQGATDAQINMFKAQAKGNEASNLKKFGKYQVAGTLLSGAGQAVGTGAGVYSATKG